MSNGVLRAPGRSLITKELRAKFPPLYANDGKDPSAVPVIAKFFTPTSSWTWYATEFDGEDRFFGLVAGLEKEFGYFSLAELESVRGPFGVGVERDKYFGSATLADVLSGEKT
jgi:hypothetical protein